MKLIGTSKEELSIYCLDAYSVGHVIFGHLAFIIAYFFGFFFPFDLGEFIRTQAPVVALCIGIAWELIENNLLIKTKIKSIKDSLNNSLYDIVCVFIGIIIGVITLLSFFNILLFVFISVILFAIESLTFFILIHITYHK